MRDINVRIGNSNTFIPLTEVSDRILTQVEDRFRGKGKGKIYQNTNRTISDALFRCEIERIRRANNF